MANKWNDIKKKFTPEQEERIKADVAKELAKIDVEYKWKIQALKAKEQVLLIYPNAYADCGLRDIIAIYPSQEDFLNRKNLIAAGWDEESAWMNATIVLEKDKN